MTWSRACLTTGALEGTLEGVPVQLLEQGPSAAEADVLLGARRKWHQLSSHRIATTGVNVETRNLHELRRCR